MKHGEQLLNKEGNEQGNKTICTQGDPPAQNCGVVRALAVDNSKSPRLRAGFCIGPASGKECEPERAETKTPGC